MTLTELVQRDDWPALLDTGRVTFKDGATTITVRQIEYAPQYMWRLYCVRPNGAMPPIVRNGGFEVTVEEGQDENNK